VVCSGRAIFFGTTRAPCPIGSHKFRRRSDGGPVKCGVQAEFFVALSSGGVASQLSGINKSYHIDLESLSVFIMKALLWPMSSY
jgi:hypothetical protein